MGLKSMHAEKQREKLQQNEQENSLIEQQIQKITELESRISKLTSVNSMLKSEMQKKSEMIKSLNETIGTLSESDNVLKQNEQLQKENEQLQLEKLEAEHTISHVKQEYTRREQQLSTLEANLSNNIRSEALKITEDRMKLLQAGFEAHTKKYDIYLAAHKWSTLISILYGILITVYTAIHSDVFLGDSKTFFTAVLSFLREFVSCFWMLGKIVAQLSDNISQPIISVGLHWLLQIVVSMLTSVLVMMGIIILCDKFFRWFKVHQADRITLTIILFNLATLVCFCDEIRRVLPINIIFLFLLLTTAAIGIRAIIQTR